MRLLTILAVTALLAACGPKAEPDAPETTLAVADSDAALPGGFTLFPGARELSRTSITQNGNSHTLLSMQSDATAAAMVAHYRQQAEAAGIAISLEVTANGLHQIGGEAPSGLNFSFTASPAEGGTSATLAIGQTAP